MCNTCINAVTSTEVSIDINKILTEIVLYEEIEELKGLDVNFKGTLSWIVEGMKFISRAINTMNK